MTTGWIFDIRLCDNSINQSFIFDIGLCHNSINQIEVRAASDTFYKLQHYQQCVCGVFFSHSFWTSSSLDVPAGVTQEEGHTGFFIHLLSAMRTLIFLARRIQPFLSLVDREVEFCVLPGNDLELIFSNRWALLFLFFKFLVRKTPFTDIGLTSQRVRRLRG